MNDRIEDRSRTTSHRNDNDDRVKDDDDDRVIVPMMQNRLPNYVLVRADCQKPKPENGEHEQIKSLDNC